MRKLAILAFSFAAGIFLAQYLLPETWLFPCAGILTLFAAASFFFHGDTRLRLLLVFLSAAAALAYNSVYVSLVQAPCEALVGRSDTFTVQLCDYPRETDYGTRVEVRILDRGLHGRAIYYGSEALRDAEPGMLVQARMSVRSAAYVYDTELNNFTSSGVFLLLYENGDESVQRGDADSLRFLPKRLAKRASETIDGFLPQREASFLRALLLGDRSTLSETDESNLSEAGMLHITAVSGMHFAFLLSLLALLVHIPNPYVLGAVAIPTLLSYALIVGGKPSVVRACLMLIMALLAEMFHRESDPLTSLSLALLVILLGNPFAAASVSLQLSFGAVLGLLWLTPKLQKKIDEHGFPKWLRRTLSSLAATAGALIFTAPLCAYYFGVLSLAAPLSNLLCLWAASITFAAGFLITACGMIFLPLARFFAFLPKLGAQYILAVAGWINRIPYHAVYFRSALLALWLLYVYAVFAAAWIGKGKRRHYALGALLSVCALALCLLLNRMPARGGKMSAAVLDVGQGQSIVLSSGEQAFLVDCGSLQSYVSAGDIAADYLFDAGYRTLDGVILTHCDADHANGLETLLARINVKEIYLPDRTDEETQEVLRIAEKSGVPVCRGTEQRFLPCGEAELTVYPPVAAGERNETGLCVLVSCGTFNLLITGDMSADAERELAQRYRLPDMEVMLVGHHGSRNSTAHEVWKALAPEVGIVSVGRNSYGHPDTATLAYLKEQNVRVYRTDQQGDIIITVN